MGDTDKRQINRHKKAEGKAVLREEKKYK